MRNNNAESNIETKYIEFIEKKIGYPITMISNGPKREDIIYR